MKAKGRAIIGALLLALNVHASAPAVPPPAKCPEFGIPADAPEVAASAIVRAKAAFQAALPEDLRPLKLGRIYKHLQKPLEKVLPRELLNDPTRPENFARLRREYPEYFVGYDAYLELVKDYESRVYAEADPSTGPDALRPPLVVSRARELAAKLALEIRLDAKIEDTKKAALLDRLERLEVFTYGSLAGIADDTTRNQAWLLMSVMCGDDLTAVNAFASFLPGTPLRPVFIVCPGLVSLVAPLTEKNHGLDFVLAHEISHLMTIDPAALLAPVAGGDPRNLDASLVATHASVLACVDAEHSGEMRTLSGVMNHLRPAVDAYEKEAGADFAKAFNAPAEVGYFGMAERWKAALEGFLGRDPTVADSHAMEILADYWATRILAPEAAKRTAGGMSARDAVRPYLGWLCAVRSPDALSDGDEGLHPSLTYRFDQFLRHPSLREAPGKWCDL